VGDTSLTHLARSMSRILLDLNNPVFQQELFVLPKAEALAVLKILRKVSQLTWDQMYKAFRS